MSGARHWAVVPAAGVGSRMRADRPKQYLPLLGRQVIEHSLQAFLDHPRIAGVVVALAADDGWWPTLPVSRHPKIVIAPGGDERCHSVLNALHALAGHAADDDWVLVHDAARPCLARSDLDRMLETLEGDAVGGILAAPVADTIKREDGTGRIAATVERQGLWRAFTPQMFRYRLLDDALARALADGFLVTDEASAMEHAGFSPRLIEGRADNIKITRPEDLAFAAFVLEGRAPA
ncbi:MAG: 2-C-methyl-D-erythritol 4-phosphate cytidylyltransferase [Chromatiales bacterium]|jgi:2-C-methyl-D-erythritol 4-phosphate cytidylyltransferase|nr:2-C-methyl-D-erythritol 4-phosphate cytidylyltransferase [Chromatiales bacterium]MDX9767947.1 2-C-methyl-D-erythritol 4-phosphate cytidylyltransferase [Ectothiorhodospiraceae bacterium]